VDGLLFDGGLLAAIMPGEHTDFHRSYEDYVDAKRRLLSSLATDAPLAYDADNLAARRLATEPHRFATQPRHWRSHADEEGTGMHRIQPIGFSLEGREADVQFYDVLLDGHGATFSLGGRALTTQSGMRFHSPLLGRGHLRNVALALTYAIAIGMPAPSAREVITSLTPLRRRMERYEIDGRTILDDTAGHPESLVAAFDVAAMLPHRNMVAAYAIRGRRGVDVNRRNAHALADICNLHGVDPLIVTSASDRAGANDLPTADEADVTRQVLVDRGRRFVWHDTLSGALGEALHRTRRGDLIVLVGAQGMDEAKGILKAEG
jgi:UDP-N-acetylmuramoyl-L-alanyl-D-glutamate--2,6-diaminopimelate ligase